MLSPSLSAILMLLAVVALTTASNRLEVPEAARIRRAPSLNILDKKVELEKLRAKRTLDDVNNVKPNERSKRDIDVDILFCPTASGELCCDGAIFRGQFDYLAQCCGKDVFDASTARCCNDQIRLTADYNLQCCGDDLYDVSKQLCCNGKTYEIQANQQCCDTAIYDVRKQICCNGTLSDIDRKALSCCGTKPYEPAISHCINDEIKDSSNPDGVTQVCGTDLIDFKKQICCENYPLERQSEPTTVCCGRATISASTQLCCNGTVIYNPPKNAQCCMSTAFDPNKQVCCNGNVYPRPDNSVGTDPYCSTLGGGLIETVDYSPYYACCGDQLVTDYTTQLCCVDQLYTYRTQEQKSSYACCGSQAYNYSEEICCQDTVSPLTYPRCCGRVPYDLNENFCCGDTLYKHNDVPADKCCGFYQNIILYED